MIVGLDVTGADQALLRELLELAVVVNERYYRSSPTYRRIDDTSVRYQPDAPASAVVIVTPARMQDTASCGSAAAAYVGWMRAHGHESHVCLRRQEGLPGVWHAYAVNPYSEPPLWDPSQHMKR